MPADDFPFFQREKILLPFSHRISFLQGGVPFTSSILLLGANRRRVRAVFKNFGGFDVFLFWSPDVSAERGYLVPPAHGILSFSVEDEGEILFHEFWGIAIGGAGSLLIEEFLVP